jgi:phage gp29-like protein
MPLNASTVNALTTKEIRRAIEDKGFSIASLARKWAELHPELNITPWKVYAVIRRNEQVVYQEIKELLADFLDVDASQLGREFSPRSRQALQAQKEQEAATA